MHTPAPIPLRTPSFAERFWSQARGPESEDVPEPLRSVVIVRHFLAVLAHLDATSPRKAAPALVAMLRAAELDGDLSYASPEQVRGEILDTRSVVFSLGVVLFERLTGRHPFGAENNRPRRVERIRRGELGSGVNSFPTVAAGLRSVLVRAMSPFPEERWPDLRQIRELLGQFVAQESPAPRLPGTQSEGEQTKIVRRATDFGRELMQVVARHDREPGPRVSQKVPVPTAGVGTVSGAAATPRRQATPKAGVAQLRPVPPPLPLHGPPPGPPQSEVSGESVVTRVHDYGVDPLGATQKLVIEDAEMERDSVVTPAPQPLPEAPEAELPLPPPLPPPRAQRSVNPQPFPVRMATPPPVAPTFGASIAPIDPASIDLRGSGKRRTLLVAVTSALVGAAVAVAMVVGMQPADEATPQTAAAPAPAPAPAAAPAPAPAPAAAEAVAAPEPAPAPLTVEQRLSDAVTPCLATRRSRILGISINVRNHAVQKPWFDASDPLTPAERGCMARALRGLPLGEVADGTVAYRVRVADGAVTFTTR